MKEYILSAANYYNDGKIHERQPENIEIGFVVCGHRHRNCLEIFSQIAGYPYTCSYPYNEFWQKVRNTEIQGFLTNTNRFVNREEAYQIACNANQIVELNKGISTNSIGLTTKDLY